MKLNVDFLVGFLSGLIALVVILNFSGKLENQTFELAPMVLQHIEDSDAIGVRYTGEDRRVVVNMRDGVEGKFYVDEGGYLLLRMTNDELHKGGWTIASSYTIDGFLSWHAKKK